MNKKNVIIGIVAVAILVVGIVVIVKLTNKKQTELIGELNDILLDTTMQNEILTEVGKDSINNLNLDQFGEYNIIVDSRATVDMIKGDKLLDKTFIDEIEVSSNNPQEYYTFKYEYNTETSELTIDIKGAFKDRNTTRQVYKLFVKDGRIRYNKTNTQVIEAE